MIAASLAWSRERRRVLALAAVAVALLLVPVRTLLAGGDSPRQTFTAEFIETPGLYAGNAVQILGVPVGSITSVKAEGTHVTVTMKVDAGRKIPADVHAVISAPNPVSDRVVELYPPYKGGAALESGATIPMSRTATPLGVDQIYRSIDDLMKTLGPTGANKDGSLSAVISSLAALTRGRGDAMHQGIDAVAGALPAFAGNSQQLGKLLDSVNTLTTLLAQHNSSIDAVLTDVTQATGMLAGERQTLASALANLQSGLTDLSAFLRANRGHLTSVMSGLATTSKAMVADQQALLTAFNVSGLAFDNVNRAVDMNAACPEHGENARCPIVFARANWSQAIHDVTNTYCQSATQELVPILVDNVPSIKQLLGINTLTNGTAQNLFCLAIESPTQGRAAQPGAPAGPDLGIAKYVK